MGKNGMSEDHKEYNAVMGTGGYVGLGTSQELRGHEICWYREM